MPDGNSPPGKTSTIHRDHTVLWVTAHHGNVGRVRPMQKPQQHEINPKTNTEIGPMIGASNYGQKTNSTLAPLLGAGQQTRGCNIPRSRILSTSSFSFSSSKNERGFCFITTILSTATSGMLFSILGEYFSTDDKSSTLPAKCWVVH